MSARTTLTQGWASKRDTPALARLPSKNSDMCARDTTLPSAKDYVGQSGPQKSRVSTLPVARRSARIRPRVPKPGEFGKSAKVTVKPCTLPSLWPSHGT
jgi:hypothetical protein